VIKTTSKESCNSEEREAHDNEERESPPRRGERGAVKKHRKRQEWEWCEKRVWWKWRRIL